MKSDQKKSPLRIAFYGKGGIGKSTIAANFSAVSAKKGYRILHIGCDPKADSTRLLTGRKIPNVLQQISARTTISREDLIYHGIHGVQCAEAGGPEAGTGCAGLGITVTMEQLETMGILKEPWDIIVYDVLGDVVCGGFAAPMRQKLVDSVCIVTSSDYMSLYAANNILKGITHFQTENLLFCGLIHNRCRHVLDTQILSSFADRIHATVLGTIHESTKITYADFCGMPLSEESPAYQEMEQTAARILLQSPQTVCPLSEEELETFRTQTFQTLQED